MRSLALHRDSEAGVRVDFAVDIGVGTDRVARAVKKIRVPNDRQSQLVDASASIICGVHLSSIIRRSPWKGGESGPCMIRGPVVPQASPGRPRGALISWCPKPATLAAHVAADHPIGQARLKRLIDDATARNTIGSERWSRRAASPRVGNRAALQYAPCRVRIRQGLHLPNVSTSVAAVLLEDAWAGRAPARREFSAPSPVSNFATRYALDGIVCR